MDRRWAGIGVLVVGLLGAAILPQLDGRGVSGTAVRGPTPVVGDCLDVTSLDVPDRATGPNGEHQLPTGSVGSCTNDSAGQLVGVVYDRTQVVLEPEPRLCWNQSRAPPLTRTWISMRRSRAGSVTGLMSTS